VSFVIAEEYWKKRAMKESELRDAFFFFSPFTEFPPPVSGSSPCQDTRPGSLSHL
jgi:hypothetical protein